MGISSNLSVEPQQGSINVPEMAAKMTLQRYIKLFAERYGTQHASVCIGNVFGTTTVVQIDALTKYQEKYGFVQLRNIKIDETTSQYCTCGRNGGNHKYSFRRCRTKFEEFKTSIQERLPAYYIEECRKIREEALILFSLTINYMQHTLILSLPSSIIEFPIIGKIFHVLLVIVRA